MARLLLLFTLGVSALAATEVNVYSARHYDSDRALYAAFTEATGIAVNLVEAKGDALHERIVSEGEHCPADVLITVDVARLWRADQAGLFQPVSSPALETAIPARFRDPAGHWFGFSKRVRTVFVTKAGKVDPDQVRHWESLADPALKGRICVRSSSNTYNQSLLAAFIAHNGADKAEAWAKAVVANMARRPQSNDTGQLRAVAAGEGDVAIANHYYYLRLLTSDKAEDRAIAEALVPVSTRFSGGGVHVNLSGAGLLTHAPNAEAGKRFLEFLVTPQAQQAFAAANHEYPAVAGVPVSEALGAFPLAEDDIDARLLGEHHAEALRVFDRAGWR